MVSVAGTLRIRAPIANLCKVLCKLKHPTGMENVPVTHRDTWVDREILKGTLWC